jgi:hypothetical protein
LATLAKLLKYIQLLARNDAAIKTDNATEFTAINANGGSGGGTFDNLTDSTEAIRDRGDAAWITGTVLDAQGVRDALKLAPTAGDPAAGSIDKELDDIGAKTTNLPSDPADESLIIAATDAIMTAVGEVNDVVKSGGTGDCAAIYSQTNKLAFDGYNVYANVDMIKNSEAAASGLAESAKTIYIGSVDDVGFAPTSTQFESSDFDEADTDFWKDCWVVFKTGTLAGQRKPITGCSLHSGKVRFTTEEFTCAPAASDTFNVL